jgi:hypothetical protein
MVTSQFGALLQELEPFFKCKLEPDINNSCLIKMANGLKVQIELDKYGEYLLIGTRLGIVSIGRYRENIFKEALKVNALHPPSNGVFGYSKKSGNLILFVTLGVRNINQDKMISVLTTFIPKAQIWMEALSRGELPIMADNQPIVNKSGVFGLIH